MLLVAGGLNARRSVALSIACAQVLFDTQRLELVRRVAVGPSVAAVVWHPKLNQIFIGTGVR